MVFCGKKLLKGRFARSDPIKTLRDYLNLSSFFTFIEATSPQLVQIDNISGELEKIETESTGLTFA